MDNKDNTIIFYITNNGLNLAKKLKRIYPDAQALKFKPQGISRLWGKSKNLIFIMAAGIVVRAIAPFIKDKKIDPAVVVLDEKGSFAISLLSGHIGGANELARKIADFLNAQAVITTASDVQGRLSLDLWAMEKNLYIEDFKQLKRISARIVSGGQIRLKVACPFNAAEMPEEFKIVDSIKDADVIISHRLIKTDALLLRPKNLVAGIGCNRGTTKGEIARALKMVLSRKGLSCHSIGKLATIDAKKNEKGLLEFARANGLDIDFFSKDELNSVSLAHGIRGSRAVKTATGAIAVSEPAAILGAEKGTILLPKTKWGNVTVAVAEKKSEARSQKSEGKKEDKKIRSLEVKNNSTSQLLNFPASQLRDSKLYIVGTGPGSLDHITPAARMAIEDADVIVGYKTYLDLIHELIKEKLVISSGMREEVERGTRAVELALKGKKVAVISGGDPGIYAMAGLIFEILKKEAEKIGSWEDKKKIGNKKLLLSQPLNFSPSLLKVEVIPGIPALSASASRLGAPLMHDFASISLSDLLTPWELIEKRLKAAAKADFVIIIYNPKSKGRTEHIKKAKNIILKYRAPQTPVGIVRAAMRDEEQIIITNLGDMLNNKIDMRSTVIIGNSQTFIWERWMVTPRGYENKEDMKMRT